MCNAYSLRRSRDELIQLGNTLQHQLRLDGEPPDWTPRYRIGPRQRGVILRCADDGATWALASWGLIPPAAKSPPKMPLTNARAEGITTTWPWKMVYRRGRCLVVADGFYEPEKPARAKGTVPWSYYRRRDDAVFAMAGLWSEAADAQTGEVIESYTVITTDAAPVIRVHDRMPVILDPADYATWLTPGELPEALLRPAADDVLEGWRVGDAARSWRSPDRADLIAPVAEDEALL